MRISDNWGILTVTGGALLGSNWDRVTLSEPAVVSANKVTGRGWLLELVSVPGLDFNLIKFKFTERS